MAEAKATTKKTTTKKKAAPKATCSDGKCSVKKVTPVPNHSPADPFKPLGASETKLGTTVSFAAELAGDVYLKTVTVIDGRQSESLLQMPGVKIVPAQVSGFYKLVSK